MTASEFAFLALGLVLGVGTGAAIVVVLGSRPPAREVRLTVEHDAVPRRAATLSSDAFQAHGEPARGGPADRRGRDRDAPANDPPPPNPFRAPGLAGIGVMSPATAFAGPVSGSLGGLHPAAPARTSVPSWPAGGPATASARQPEQGNRPVMANPPAAGERDPSLDALRIQAVLAAQHALQAGQPTATALLEARPPIAPASDGEATPVSDPGLADALPSDETPAVIRILRGDHRALLRTIEVLAGTDGAMRRPWQGAILGLAEGIIGRAIERGVLDFPVGNPFWDTFTTDQCRDIAGALSATGFRFDGIDGWADERVPTYRDLTAALAVVGLEPRRMRSWPTQDEISRLYAEVTVAADEFLAAEAPAMELEDVRDLVGGRAPDLDVLWSHWSTAGRVLALPVPDGSPTIDEERST